MRKLTRSFGCSATQSTSTITRFSPRVQMWKGILAKIRPDAKPEPLPPLKLTSRHGLGGIGDGENPILAGR
jgi:hypothetical protein